MDERDARQSLPCRPSRDFLGWVFPLLAAQVPMMPELKKVSRRPHESPPPLLGLSEKRTKSFSHLGGQLKNELQHGVEPAALTTWAGIYQCGKCT